MSPKRKTSPKPLSNKKLKAADAHFLNLPDEVGLRVMSYLSPTGQQLSRGACRMLRKFVDTKVPFGGLVNRKWKRGSDYQLSGGADIDLEQVTRTDGILKELGIDYGKHVTAGSSFYFPYGPSDTNREVEMLAFEEAFALKDRLTRGKLNIFYHSRHEHFCYISDMDMKEWSFYVLEYYLDRINEMRTEMVDLVPVNKKIGMMDLYRWVEHHRMDEFSDVIHIQNNIESWKFFWYSQGYVETLFQSL